MTSLTEAERTRRHEQLRATYERLAAGAAHAITATDLAQEIGWDLYRVYRLLGKSPWWTPERAAAARQEHVRRLHEQTKGQGYRGVVAMQHSNRAASQAWATTLFEIYCHLQEQLPVVTPEDLARAAGMGAPGVRGRLAQAAWWTHELAAAAKAEQRRRQHLQLARQEAERVVDAVRPFLPCASARRTLQKTQILEIRRRLAQGATPTELARLFGVHKNTICALQQGRSWASVTEERTGQEPGEEAIPPVMSIREADSSALVLPPPLWRAFKAPAHVQLCRRQRDQALVLVPSTTAGIPASCGPLSTLTLPSEILHQLGLTPGEYRWSLSSNKDAICLSDVPETASTDLITIAEVCQLLGISRQGVSQLIAAGRFQVHFDAGRHKQVVSRAAIQTYARTRGKPEHLPVSSPNDEDRGGATGQASDR